VGRAAVRDETASVGVAGIADEVEEKVKALDRGDLNARAGAHE